MNPISRKTTYGNITSRGHHWTDSLIEVPQNSVDKMFRRVAEVGLTGIMNVVIEGEEKLQEFLDRVR